VSIDFHLDEARPQAPLASAMFHEWIFPDGTPWTRFHRDDADYLLRFVDLADFHVSSDGSAVRCWPAPDVSEESVRFLFANQVMPLALSRQGTLVFHASAVEIDQQAVAFMGASGRGKSTLAASFATSGFRFLTDDGLVVESAEGQWRIAPSHPSIRLWEDSQDALLGQAAPTAPPVQYTSKPRFLAGSEIVFCDQPRVLHRVYFLGMETHRQPVFERLKPSDALIELLKHSFLLDIEERQMLAAHFDELSSMVNQPIYYRLDYPRYFADLAEVRQAIIEHARDTSDPP
jgi:hypothetical protein